MDALNVLAVLAQAETPGNGSNLLGIAAIITAVGAIFLGLLRYWRKPAGDDGLDTELAAAIARERQVLRNTIEDLERSLATCRSERQVLIAESKVKDMEIGSLQGRLADARARKRDLDDR